MRPKLVYESSRIDADVHADEDRGEPAEEAVEVEDPRRAGAERPDAAREPQAPDHARAEQRPGDDAAGAGRVPEQVTHLVSSRVLVRRQTAVASSRAYRDQCAPTTTPAAVGDHGGGAEPLGELDALDAVEERDRAQDLGPPGVGGDRGRVQHRRDGAPAGRGIDHVVALDAVGRRPAPARPRRGGDATVGDGHVRDRLVVGRVAERDHPRVAGAGGRTGDAQVATDVHAHARGAERAQLVGDQVGGEALADPTGIEAGAGRERDGAGVGVDGDRRRRRRGGGPAPGRPPGRSSDANVSR